VTHAVAERETAAAAPIRLVHITTVPMSLTFLRGQIAHMKQRGYEIIAVSSPGAELEHFGREQDIEVVGVDMPRAITPLRDARALTELTAVLRRLHPTIVHAHTPKGGLLGMLGASLAKVPVRIYHMRGLPMMTAHGARRRLLSWTERVSCHAAHQVIAVSSSLKDIAIAERLCPRAKITTLAAGSGNGIDATRFDRRSVDGSARLATRARYDIPDDAIVIGFVGRIVQDKGVVELLDAVEMLFSEFPTLHVLLVGMLEERDAVPTGVRHALEAHPRIHWRGEDWNTPPLYAAMDVVALPTYREGFPNVPLEAAAMMLPVVATDIPGCRDAIAHEQTGILVPPRDATALAGALRRYLGDEALRSRHGEAARARVLDEFRQEVIWNELDHTYRDLIARTQ
jgi:glycosyltransferase involved in cell wall biosynthesis